MMEKSEMMKWIKEDKGDIKRDKDKRNKQKNREKEEVEESIQKVYDLELSKTLFSKTTSVALCESGLLLSWIYGMVYNMT